MDIAFLRKCAKNIKVKKTATSISTDQCEDKPAGFLAKLLPARVTSTNLNLPCEPKALVEEKKEQAGGDVFVADEERKEQP